MVTREELKQHLWPSGIYVEFNRSLNAAVKRLRRALNDSPRNPRFIQTVPKLGYRFIGKPEIPAEAASRPRADGQSEQPVVFGDFSGTPEPIAARARSKTAFRRTTAATSTSSASASSRPTADTGGKREGGRLWLAIALVVLLATGLAVLWQAGSNRRAEKLGSPSQRLLDSFPFDDGRISPDGRYIAYTSLENHRLRLRDLESQSDRLLVGDRTAPELTWSPDSKRLALASGRDGIYRLEILRVESGERQVLREGSSFDDVRVPMAWDADGNRLLCGTRGGDWYGFLSLRDLTLTPLKMPRSRIY